MTKGDFMKKDKGFIFLLITLGVVFILSAISLIFAEQLEAAIAVVGIRIAVLIVSFAAFGASAIFSMMVYKHNITASKINDDSNKRSDILQGSYSFTQTRLHLEIKWKLFLT